MGSRRDNKTLSITIARNIECRLMSRTSKHNKYCFHSHFVEIWLSMNDGEILVSQSGQQREPIMTSLHHDEESESVRTRTRTSRVRLESGI